MMLMYPAILTGSQLTTRHRLSVSTDGVEVFVGEQVLTRAETAQIIFNMLYTTPADGGLTIAAKNFGEQTAANTTTLVVTATPEPVLR